MFRVLSVFWFFVLGLGSAFATYVTEGICKDFFGPEAPMPFVYLEKMIDPEDTILEAGALDGKESLELAKIVHKGQVLSFEPNPSRFPSLSSKAAQVTNIKAFPFALGDQNAKVPFYVCYGAQYDPAYEGASSLLPPAECMKINYQGPIIEVMSYRIDDWCKEYKQSKIDFMWLDLEGGELQALKGAVETLKNVKLITIETNFFEYREGMTQFPELNQFLEENGFCVLAHGYTIGGQGNAVFVRKTLFNEMVQRALK